MISAKPHKKGSDEVIKTIVFSCQKGGNSKTSTAVITAYALAAEGESCLLVDLDSQCNATDLLVPYKQRPDKTVRTVLTGKCKPEQAVYPCDIGYIMPADEFLSVSDIKTAQSVKTILTALQGRFSYTIIDTPPALQMPTLSALVAADYAVIPTRADPLGCTAIKTTLDTIRSIEERANKGLCAGVLPVMFNGRTSLHKAYLEALLQIADAYGARTFSPIRSGIAVAEAQALHRSLFSYAPKASVTADYKKFVSELKETVNNG